MTKWVTPHRAALLTDGNVSRQTITRWAKEGLIEAIHLPNGQYRVRSDAIQAFMTPVPVQQLRADQDQEPHIDKAAVQ